MLVSSRLRRNKRRTLVWLVGGIVLSILAAIFVLFCCAPVVYIVQVIEAPIFDRLDDFQPIRFGYLINKHYSIVSGNYHYVALKNQTTLAEVDLWQNTDLSSEDPPDKFYLLLPTQKNLYFITYEKSAGWLEFKIYNVTTDQPVLVSENYSCSLPAYRDNTLEFFWDTGNYDLADACSPFWPDPNVARNWVKVPLE
jgi:hypothetical protein